VLGWAEENAWGLVAWGVFVQERVPLVLAVEKMTVRGSFFFWKTPWPILVRIHPSYSIIHVSRGMETEWGGGT
jgi:hypothetical protein